MILPNSLSQVAGITDLSHCQKHIFKLKAGDIAVKHLSSMHNTLGSIPRTAKIYK
jgi:hypothetical protein